MHFAKPSSALVISLIALVLAPAAGAAVSSVPQTGWVTDGPVNAVARSADQIFLDIRALIRRVDVMQMPFGGAHPERLGPFFVAQQTFAEIGGFPDVEDLRKDQEAALHENVDAALFVRDAFMRPGDLEIVDAA